MDTIDDVIETPDQLMSQITFEGCTQLQTKLKALILEFIDVFATLLSSLIMDCLNGTETPAQKNDQTPKVIFHRFFSSISLSIFVSSLLVILFLTITQNTWHYQFLAVFHRKKVQKNALVKNVGVGHFFWAGVRVAMGLKGSGSFFQRSMANKVLAGYVTRKCEIYIDDVLLFGTTDIEYISNTRKVLGRLRENNVTANPAKTKFGLKEVEYVGHLITSTGTSFTEEKRLQVLDFPLPETEKALLQFIGLVNYFRDHVPKMTEMVQPLRKLMDMKKYKGSKKLTWTDEAIELSRRSI